MSISCIEILILFILTDENMSEPLYEITIDKPDNWLIGDYIVIDGEKFTIDEKITIVLPLKDEHLQTEIEFDYVKAELIETTLEELQAIINNVTATSVVIHNRKFTTSISNLNYGNITNIEFRNCKFQDMESIFKNRDIETINLKYCDAGNSMKSAFEGCSSLTELNITNLDTSNVTDMSNMFYGCSSLSSVSNLDTSNATDMSNMFYGCEALASVSNLDTSNATDMSNMFNGCSSLSSVSNLDTSNATDMSNMFNGCEALASCGTISVKGSSSNMFKNCKLIQELTFDDFTPTDMSNMFYGCEKLKTINITNFIMTDISNMNNTLYHCYKLDTINIDYMQADHSLTNISLGNSASLAINKLKMYSATGLNKILKAFDSYSISINDLDISDCIDLSRLFASLTSLSELTIGSANTSNVTDMSNMFDGCRDLLILDLSAFDTSEVTNMSGMFYDCQALNSLTIPFDVQHVTDMSNMFYQCVNLYSLDLSSFYSPHVIDISKMFYKCKKLRSLDLTSLHTYNVTNMCQMFYDCEELESIELDASFSDVKVENMTGMFENCKKLEVIDLSSFTTPTNCSAGNMFFNCINLRTIYTNYFAGDGITNGDNMFKNCTSLVGGNGTTYDINYVGKERAYVDNENRPGYFTRK